MALATPSQVTIPAESLSQALIDLARQTGGSIGGVDPALCQATPRAVRGATARAAMQVLLRDSRCRFSEVEPDVFVLKLKPRLSLHLPIPRPKPVKADAPVEVMVSRRVQDAASAASAISVIDAQSLAQKGDLNDLAGQVAGLTLTNLGAGRDKILLRGLSDGVFTGRTQSSVGLYLDDLPITYNAPDPDLLLVDMARIEVLKGPQGALYGEGSVSGVVRLVTRTPDLSRFAADMGVDVGLSDRAGTSNRVEAMLNLPLVKDRLGVRLVGYTDNQGGYIDNLATSTKHSNGVQRFGGRLAATWRLNDAWTVSVQRAEQHINAKDSQYVSGDLGTYNRAVPVREPHDNDFAQSAFNLQGRLPWATLKLSLGHLHHQLDSRYDASALAGLYGLPDTPGRVYDQAQVVELTTRELTLVSPSTQPLRWLAGVFSAQSTERLTPQLSETLPARIDYREQRHDGVMTLAAFGEISYDIAPHWTVSVGLRETHMRHDLDSQLTTDLSGAMSAQTLHDHMVSMRLSHQVTLRYRPSDNATLYFQSGEGYRSGGFNTTHLAGTDAIPARYAGDELNSYEFGAKLRWPETRAGINMALYKAYWRDLQSDQIQPDGLPVTVNIGNGVNLGLEVEAYWMPVANLTLKAVGLVNDPHLTRPNPSYVTLEDSGLPYISPQSFNLSADWQKQAGALIWHLGGDVNWRGHSHLNFGALQAIQMGGYAQVSLHADLERGDMRYRLRLDNAFAADGNSFAYGNPFSLSQSVQSTPPRPRTLWLGVSRSF